MSIKKYLYFVLLCLLAACDTGSQPRLDQETLEQEKRRREPRRIKEGEIIAAGLEQGQALVNQLHQNFLPEDSSSCCPDLPAALLDSLQNQHQARIRCFALTNGAAPSASSLERELLEAYQYSLEQNLPLEANLQAEGTDYFIYTAPVTNGATTNSSCAIWSIQLSRKEIVLNM